MKTLPDKSQGNIRSGLWFVFPLTNHTIRAWGSLITGMECIYLDEDIVSEHRSMGKTSQHEFDALNSKWKIEFKTISLLRGQLQCTLFQDNKKIHTYHTGYTNVFKRIGIFSATAFIIVLAGGLLHLPSWLVILLLVGTLMVLNRFQPIQMLIQDAAYV